MKKTLAAMLCAIVLFVSLPLGVAAQEDLPEQEQEQAFSVVEAIKQEARSSYYKSQKTAGKRSFHGKCGALVGHQLYNLGINNKVLTFSGNQSYDYYAVKEKTSGGYYITTYPVDGYSLYEALMAVSQEGTKVVRNILVGFQWSSSEAGRKFGHTLLINGIVDGIVYFVESFDSATLGGAEGSVLSCTIREFADYYNKWTVFEGLVHFGTGTYYDVCSSTPTDVTVQTRFETVLRSEPAVVGQHGCVQLRKIAAGERLNVTGIYEADRTFYYRVKTNDGIGFVAAGAVRFVQVNTEGISISDLALPSHIQPGTVPAFSGMVSDTSGSIGTLEVCITDTQGQMVRWEQMEITQGAAQLQDLRDLLWFDLLDLGAYRVDIYISRACLVVAGKGTQTRELRVLLGSRGLYVGNNPREMIRIPGETPAVQNGWFRENETWYYYENNAPRTGWVTHWGVRYYLQDNGSVVTGEQMIDGKPMYFSATGALVTGWLVRGDKLYCYGSDGVLLTNTEEVKDGKTFTIAADGTATEKQEMQDGETLF